MTQVFLKKFLKVSKSFLVPWAGEEGEKGRVRKGRYEKEDAKAKW